MRFPSLQPPDGHAIVQLDRRWREQAITLYRGSDNGPEMALAVRATAAQAGQQSVAIHRLLAMRQEPDELARAAADFALGQILSLETGIEDD